MFFRLKKQETILSKNIDQQLLVNYLKFQLARDLRQDSLKRIKLKEVLEEISLNDFDAELIKTYIGKVRMIVAKHQDTGIKGFFKATFLRNPESFNDFNKIFDENCNVRKSIKRG